MERETLHIEQFIPEFEAFISNEEKHEFSKKYAKYKKKILKKYRKDVLVPMRKKYMKVAAFVGIKLRKNKDLKESNAVDSANAN